MENSDYRSSYFDREYFKLHEGKAIYLSFLAGLLTNYNVRGNVMDIGSGYGFFLEVLDKMGYNTFGIELSPHAIEHAKSRTRAKLLNQSADSGFLLQNNIFDAVTMFDVIEHISNYRYSLEEVYRVLKPGGRLFIVTLNSESVVARLLGRRWSWYRDTTHIHLFSSSSLESTLRDTGFKVIKTRTLFNFNVAGETTRWLRPLRYLKRIWFVPKFGDSILAISEK